MNQKQYVCCNPFKNKEALAKKKRTMSINKVMRLTVILLFMKTFCFAQDPALKVLPPSPNAASLGVYGQIPVSLFSGLPQISIPVAKSGSDEVDIDLSLNYHGGGVRPDQHGSWVGLGWDLNAGGVITRKRNGGVDEFLDPALNPKNRFSYFDNYGQLDNNNWYSVNSLSQFADAFNQKAIPDPDEFIFNFGGYSGSFFYNHKGKWQVKSNQLIDLKVEEELKNDFTLPAQQLSTYPLTLPRIFYKFTITTPDGTKYIFGGTPESIEFSRPASDNFSSYFTGIIANSWFLTKVITNTRKEIKFSYDRGNIIATQSRGLSIYSTETGGLNSRGGDANAISTSIVNPVYLKEIATEDQKVVFSRSISGEMPYNYILDNGQQLMTAAKNYPDLSTNEDYSEIIQNIKWQKLDSISVYALPSGFLKKISFSYLEQNNSRLILNSIQITGSDGTQQPPYEFSYNQTPLPEYNSRKLDHWGFYNGRNYFDEIPKYTNIEQLWTYTYVKSNVPAFTASKASNFSLMEAGSLISIRYPTGGKTNFEYEPHEYSLIAKRNPFVVEGIANTKCGGLRIAKISDLDETGKIVSVKEYKYLLNLNRGGTTSSGVLAGVPVYLEENQAKFGSGYVNYWYWYDYSIEPLSFTNGNHVTYTEVAEKLADGSYTVFNYSNHDKTEYRDSTALASVHAMTTNAYVLDPGSTKELYRGTLLEKKVFNSANLIQKSNEYKYKDLVVGPDKDLRIVDVRQRIFNFGSQVIDVRATALWGFIQPKFLDKEIEILYDKNGLNPIRKSKTFTYTFPERLVKTQKDSLSNGKTTYTEYSYPGNMLSKDPTGIYREMFETRHIYTPVIEKRTDYPNGQSEYQKTGYFKPFYEIYVPEYFSQSTSPNTLDVRTSYNAYDDTGNLVTFSRGGPKTTYIWAYNKQHVIAEVKNAEKNQIACANFEEYLDGDGQENNTNFVFSTRSGNPYSNDAKTGKRSLKFGPLDGGETIDVLPLGLYTVSYWSKGGMMSLEDVSDQIESVPDKDGWVYHEGILNIWNNPRYFYVYPNESETTILIDDLRVYPMKAQMTTYTYDSFGGLTSKTDEKGNITYFEYDGFQRLKNVKDQKRNILKNTIYHYKQ
ncbi:RHS repeat domain-containing protein [Pedobacter sp.]|jgi:YD repeat-containing protein|uniref:RHS repeat domain-containing protein n=1 Tax=Pedobacter sp. TaxID=1411316 RepID=UPI002BF094A3|nr:RHS repeat domain-containing protein [Pedobacter sp.]HWW40855.1 RHS repeat domain-containing protein [Pedobacter sp.]